MTTIAIDYSSKQHKQIIIQLCKRNTFYINDIASHLYCNEDIELHRPFLKHVNLPIRIETATLILMSNKLKKLNQKGFLLTVNIDNKTKVVGFVMFNITDGATELLFLLVDKSWRKKGFGKDLMNAYHSALQNEISIIQVEETTIPFYKKFGYKYERTVEDSIYYIKTLP